jgi:hypothetical protein
MVDNKELESGLKAMAEDFLLPGGGHKKLSQLVAGHMHWFDAAERRGMGWRDMIRALTAAGVNARGGKPVKKLATLRRWLADDHRVRQVYRYHGAMPGRFSSIGAQMQNLKKPAGLDIDTALKAVNTGKLDAVRTQFQRPLEVIGSLTRAMIVPAPGHRLFIADLSGIESRGLAWITGEKSKLDAWRKFDETGDPTDEPYMKLAKDFGITGDEARGKGKTCDLAFQYQGSIGAWRRLAGADDDTPDDRVLNYQRAWRSRHPNIIKFWASRSGPPCWRSRTPVCASRSPRSRSCGGARSSMWNCRPAGRSNTPIQNVIRRKTALARSRSRTPQAVTSSIFTSSKVAARRSAA